MPHTPGAFRQTDRMPPNTENGLRIDIGNTDHLDQMSAIEPMVDSAMDDKRIIRVGDEEFTYGPGSEEA